MKRNLLLTLTLLLSLLFTIPASSQQWLQEPYLQKDSEVTFKDMKAKLLDEVKRTFKPEFLNRLDDINVFRPLTKADLVKIVDIEIASVQKRLAEQDIKLDLSKEAKELLIEKGFNPVFGARPLKRTIQRFLEDLLSEEIIAKRFKSSGKIKVVRKKDELVFS